MIGIKHRKNADTRCRDPALQSSIRDIDYTQGHKDTILTEQTNDQERYTMTEKIILELVVLSVDDDAEFRSRCE